MRNRSDLTFRQNKSLPWKIQASLNSICEFYEKNNGMVYLAMSGGRDSTALGYLIRSIYPDVPFVFCDTGLEYPEIKTFVKTFSNLTILKPKKSFRKVLESHGYPILSKKVAMGISRYRNTKDPEQKWLRLYGGICPSSGKKQYPTIPKKYHHLTEAPFKISDYCCQIMKKQPFKRYQKLTGRVPYIGTMAEDSDLRRIEYLKDGCNKYYGIVQSKPLSVWKKSDVIDYLKDKNYCSIYDGGYQSTGCMFCMFGIVQESKKGLNRFQKMKVSHPRHYNVAMKTFRINKILDFLNIPY